MSTPVLFWFRRDLRLADNPALTVAVERAGAAPVFAVYVFDEALLAPAGPTRVAYLTATLDELAARVPLTMRVGRPATALLELAREAGARHVVATGDHGPYGAQRDQAVVDELAREGVTLEFVDSNYVVAPGTVRSKTGEPFKVFTAFRRGWELNPAADPLPAPTGRFDALSGVSSDVARSLAGTRRPTYFGDRVAPTPPLPPVGEAAAARTLTAFVSHVDRYAEERNEPSLEGTSRLSPYLRFGVIHPRQVLHATRGLSDGRRTFESEIAWREFYADVLWHHPASVREVLQPVMNNLRVDRDERAVERFHAWAWGETGYPLVDAGMRQLLTTGWMHNRVRMVAASFLVKHLHLDWRWGARWFMWHLVDGDVASNQHGWQWAAGTGTDAAPYHRVFNPTLQAERFDATGAYVQRYVPELASTPAPACLQPGGGEGLLRPAEYPAPLVDAATERNEALARFAEARGK